MLVAESWRNRLGRASKEVHVNTKTYERVSGINYAVGANSCSGRSLPNLFLLGDIR